MEKIVYSKLFPDRIHTIIEADGKTCVTEALSDARYLEMLDAKLNEELAEYQESHSLEELADLLEVLRAVVLARGWTWEQLEEVRRKKVASYWFHRTKVACCYCLSKSGVYFCED